jgi:hypothetical protein
MADFIAVLRNAIDRLSDKSPLTREKIYRRARATLEQRLVVVGPTPTAAAERHRHVLEAAITRVESFYASWIDDGSIAEAAVAPGHTLASYNAPSVAGGGPATDESFSETAQEAGDFVKPVHDEDVGEAQFTGLTAARVDAIATVGEGNARLGNVLPSMVPGEPEAAMCGTPATIVASTTFQQLEWGTSEKCGVCHKWALCVDQTQCWHRWDHRASGIPVTSRSSEPFCAINLSLPGN